MTDGNTRESPNLPRASRVGLTLFAVYVLLYGGFIGLVLLRPDLLVVQMLGGVNLAIVSGLGLILAAVLLAVVSLFGRADR